jgi:hypothetical protein
LDWTSDVWTAIYFASASEGSNDAELWYYDRNLFDRRIQMRPELASLLDEGVTLSHEPTFLELRFHGVLAELDPRMTPRMKHQKAHHTVSTDVFSDHAPSLYELVREHEPVPPQSAGPAPTPKNDQAPDAPSEPETVGPRPRFGRVLIGGACKVKALQFLAEQKNVTASRLFPDVVGLGRFLRWQLESLRNMILD